MDGLASGATDSFFVDGSRGAGFDRSFASSDLGIAARQRDANRRDKNYRKPACFDP
jgi:hypothetical protein